MRILVISSYLPYPLFSGGHVRLYNLLKEISKRHQIVLVCEKRTYQTKEDEDELRKICQQVITVPRDKQWTIKNILKTGFSSYPFLLTGHANNLMKEKIRVLLEKEQFDLVHIETFYVMQNLPSVSLPVVLVDHNIEYLVYKRYAHQSTFFIKPILSLDILKLRYWEKLYWKKATQLIAVSKDEEVEMKKNGIKNVSIVPNGVDIEKFKIKNSKLKIDEEKKILFLGDFKWIKNLDATKWLIKEIWPEIKLKIKNQKSKPNVKLWIVGKKIPLPIKKLGENDQDIIFDENAPEKTEEIFKEANLLIAPIRVGGGTSFKILEAMASGVPVVTTSFGIEGIEAIANKDVFVSNNANEIADKSCQLLFNKNLYENIAKNARKLIEEKYDWKKITKNLEVVYQAATRK